MLQSKDVTVGILSGFIAALLVTAIGGRIIMRIIAIVDPFAQPRFSMEGTSFLVIMGIIIGATLGAPWGLLYISVRGLFPVPTFWKGFIFGLLLLLISGGVFFSMEQGEEFSDFKPPLLGVALFALMFPIYGLLVGIFTEQLYHWLSTTRESRLKIVGYIIFSIICLLGLLFNIGVISEQLQ